MSMIDTAIMVLINLIWGLNFIAVKWAVADFPPMVTNSLRFTLVLVFLLPYLRLVPGRMRAILLAALTLGFLHFGTMFIGMHLAEDVSSMAIASQLAVPFATLLAILFLGEHVGWKRGAGIAVSFAGVLVLGFDPQVFSYIGALLLMSLAAFWYALSTIFMRRVKDVPAMTTQAWVAVAGIAGSLIFSALFEQGQVEALHNAHWQAWVSIFYTGILSSIVGHGGVNYMLRKYEVSVVTPYFLLMPLFAIMGGVVILGETLTWRIVLGGVITLVGVMIVTLRNAKKAKALQEEIEENMG